MELRTVCKNCLCVIKYDPTTVGDFVECPGCSGRMPITKKPTATVNPAPSVAKTITPVSAPAKSVTPATPKSTYQSLKELRSAIAALPVAEQDLKMAQYRKEKAQKELAKSKEFVAAPKPSTEKKYTAKLKAEFEKEAREADRVATERLRNKIRDKNTNSRKGLRVGLIILAILVFAFTAAITFFVARWSWNSSIFILLQKLDSTYNEAVAVHLMGLTFALLISALVCYVICRARDIWDSLIIVNYVLVALAILSLIVAIKRFTMDVDGFWETLLQLFGLIIAAFVSFNSTWRILAFVACITISVLSTLMIFSYALKLKPKKKGYFNEKNLSYFSVNKAMRELDYTQFYESDVYKEAKQLDDEYNCEQDRLNLQNHKDNIPVQTRLIEAYDAEIKRYQGLIQKCKNTIQNATFLHASYRNLASLDTIIYYFDYNRADTIKEAINQYISDQQHFAVINKLGQLEKNQLNAMKNAVNTITKKLDSVSNTIKSEIADVRQATERQTRIIEEESQKLREENEKQFRVAQKNADRRAEQLDERLAKIISNQYLTHETLRRY